jgi:DNA repair ATPase RecN
LELPRDELKSEMTVTAAHEMLHAALARLPSGEWQDLRRELEEQYRELNDPELADYLKSYSDPESRLAELHAVFGTEYRGLSPELEAHYRRYFRDRSSVLAAHERFEAVFDSLQAELVGLEAQIKDLERRMKAYEAAGDFRSYNSLVNPINTLIRRYNQKVAEYNELTLNARGEIKAVPGR